MRSTRVCESSSSSTSAPRAARCGSSMRSSMLRTGPTAAPASASWASHSAAGLVANTAASSSARAGCPPAGFIRDSARSGRSMAAQNAAHVRGSAAARVTSLPSAARYAAARRLAPPGRLPGGDARDGFAEHPGGAVDDRGVDERALPRAVAFGERGEDADHRDQRAEGHREHEVGRWRHRVAGHQGHEPRVAEEGDVVRGSLGVGAALAEAGDRAPHEAGLVGGEGGEVDALPR